MTPGPDAHRGEQPKTHRHRHGSHGLDEAWSAEEAMAYLESPERRRLLDPEAFWERVELAPGSSVADVGAGTGYFALPAARRVGPGGRVYAIDISEAMVRTVERRASAFPGVLEAVLARPGAIPLPSAVADVVLLATVLHDISEESLRESVRLLRPTGRLLNLDWKKDGSEMGPPREVRLSPAEAEQRLAALGLVAFDAFDPGPFHYAAQFRFSPGPVSDR